MGFSSTMYNLVFRRTSRFTVAVLASAFVFERGFDMASEKIFDTINKGKQWKDIKHKYEN
ncbi:PREDICTED: cytochrome b-c1 complex subunit 9 [Atta cephalotes]|uniref:Complex III subunit 9 n=2 Tax=Atta TaxID=12956 RepID=A0A158P2S6_ATTCE|nr:PREDICTED: cytochrome b-c1 complex subunit 9 [Atta cephalotes]XP_018059280.1 PREDICTED: cytochrome b-c1 complex subunit 9 [Atta colombica]KYM89581.1 Cytochrome b-c1 complex subunit 9 [Atta colombica]